MKNSIWVINSLLLVLFIIMSGFLSFFQPTVPLRKSLAIKKTDAPAQKRIFVVNTKRIYENDLFGTYKASTEEVKTEFVLPSLPAAPTAPPVIQKQADTPEFLEPLPLTLSGIFIDSDESKSRAIVVDTKTTLQKSYQIGDVIGDAELLRIFENSILLVRSNGQEETLFIDKQSTLQTAGLTSHTNWDDTIEKVSEESYFIDPQNFITRITHLSQFLEAIDATTVYKKGKAFGIRIGKIGEGSVGRALGLESGDIITIINDMPTITTQERVHIYSSIKKMNSGDTCTVNLLRQGNLLHRTYTIKALVKKVNRKISQKFENKIIQPAMLEEVKEINSEDEKSSLAEAKNAFSSRINTIQKKDRRAIMHRGSFKKYA